MLEVRNLSKMYISNHKKHRALNRINFTLEEGDHLALIGSNGSGKTTLIKIITQLSHPTSGSVLLDGVKLSENSKGQFGLMLGNSIIYNRLTVKQNLDYFSTIYNVPDADLKIEYLLRKLGILDRQNDYVEHLSEGLKSKVAFARAIIHDPRILILDEPTNGVDPISTDILLWEIKKYPTVMFSSHNLYEVIDIANKVLIINQGEQVYFGDMKDFKHTNVEKTKKELIGMYNEGGHSAQSSIKH